MPFPNLAEPVPDQDHVPRALAFTPAEWRSLLEDPAFLSDQDNRYSVPRRLLELPVKIVPDHGSWG